MPSPAEHSILLSVLTAVFASLPFAIVIRSFFSQPDRTVAAQRAAMRMAAEAVPAEVIAPPPIPPPWGNQTIPEISSDPWMPPHSDLMSPPKGPAERSWTRKDAWFAVFLAVVVALLLFPVSVTGDAEASGSDRVNVPLTTLFTISIIVQGAMVALVLVWLGVHRRFNVVSLFGLRRMSLLKSAGVAFLVLIPAWFGLNYITYYLEPVLRYLTGLDVKPQMMVEKASEI
ncbi:MAG TPA: hypothetical protein VHM91_06045, partial [Verrucomicrobiales bacterium]|nr:hypothetical protein [Verrucomicrobiales bacterium]